MWLTNGKSKFIEKFKNTKESLISKLIIINKDVNINL
jgi:hypothetical protein